jgi:hypothetical protein
MSFTDAGTVLWTMTRGDRTVACQVRLVPYGIEVDILYDDRVTATRTFDTDTDALAWAEKKRAAREASGWTAQA